MPLFDYPKQPDDKEEAAGGLMEKVADLMLPIAQAVAAHQPKEGQHVINWRQREEDELRRLQLNQYRNPGKKPRNVGKTIVTPGVPGLFNITDNPNGIQRKGKDSKMITVPMERRSRNDAFLRFAKEKHERNEVDHKKISITAQTLRELFNNKKYCRSAVKSTDIRSDHDLLYFFLYDLNAKVADYGALPFAEHEIKLEVIGENDCLTINSD